MPVTVNDTLQDLSGNPIRSVPRIKSDDEIERDAVMEKLRAALPLLAVAGQNAKSVTELTAMSPTERIQRQAVLEDVIALQARVQRALIKLITDL